MGMCMKKKCFITVISIIAAIAIGIISLPFLIRVKIRYEYSVTIANANKAFEEMIAFCEENQNEIEAYSSQYLAMRRPDMSDEELMKLEKQIMEELDCEWMFEKISVSHNPDERIEGIVLFDYKEYFCIGEDGIDDPRAIEIFYLEKRISQQKFEEMGFFSTPNTLVDIKKINAHLYVCMRGYMCL